MPALTTSALCRQEPPWPAALLGPAGEGSAHEDDRQAGQDRGRGEEALSVVWHLLLSVQGVWWRICARCNGVYAFTEQQLMLPHERRMGEMLFIRCSKRSTADSACIHVATC